MMRKYPVRFGGGSWEKGWRQYLVRDLPDSLELTDSGFDFSVLSEFRDRLIAGGVEQLMLNTLLGKLKELNLVRAGGRQRTDSTHVLAAVHEFNRLEFMAETLRQTRNLL